MSREEIVYIPVQLAVTFDTSIGWHCFTARCPVCLGKIVHSRSICREYGQQNIRYMISQKERNCST